MISLFLGFIVGGVLGFLLCSLICVGRSGDRHITNPKTFSDRRELQKATFPLVDSGGTIVIADRRLQLDRRLRPRM